MRNLNQRLVIFSSNFGDVTPTNGIMHTDTHRETEYNLDNFQNCEMRQDRDTTSASTLFVMNHFYSTTLRESLIPIDSPHIAINSFGFIMDRAIKCKTQQSRRPNFLAVDFVGKGEAREAVLALNAEWMADRQPVTLTGFTWGYLLGAGTLSSVLTYTFPRYILPFFRLCYTIVLARAGGHLNQD